MHLLPQPRSEDQGSCRSQEQKDLLTTSDICMHAICGVVPDCSVNASPISGSLICQRQKNDLRKCLTPVRLGQSSLLFMSSLPPITVTKAGSYVSGNSKLTFYNILFFLFPGMLPF